QRPASPAPAHAASSPYRDPSEQPKLPDGPHHHQLAPAHSSALPSASPFPSFFLLNPCATRDAGSTRSSRIPTSETASSGTVKSDILNGSAVGVRSAPSTAQMNSECFRYFASVEISTIPAHPRSSTATGIWNDSANARHSASKSPMYSL